ncbi:MAG: thermonuclease family protein [Thermodesulfovibrionales bacterium]|nr:thermonuclease family protein [Thermodesulfovibrionales bacterium]
MANFYYILLFFLIFSLCPITLYSITTGNPFIIAEVHDGDTISVKTKIFFGIAISTEKVRLIGIDAPEMDQEPWGRRAKKHLKKLIDETDGAVYLEFDIDKRDKHGRILAYVWDKRGRMLNQRMLEDGYAVLYTVPPNVRYVKLLTDAQQKARLNKVGIWGKDGLKRSPQEWRRENPRK